MPLYTVACRKGLSQEIRAAVSTAITDTHCDVTDAPAEFVNVIFMDGYSLKKGYLLSVIGGVRSGGNRNSELIEKLQGSLLTNVGMAANLSMEKVSIQLFGVKASWVMEGGKILPEPGAENEWQQNTK